MAEGDALHKAVDLLARRPHFEAEIRRKLQQRGFDESEVDVAVERLHELRYLDDALNASSFVNERLRRSPVGRRRLRADLVRKGADAEAIEAALQDLSARRELNLARHAAERWLARGRGDSQALARHLDRQGFSPGDIVTVIAEVRREEPSD